MLLSNANWTVQLIEYSYDFASSMFAILHISGRCAVFNLGSRNTVYQLSRAKMTHSSFQLPKAIALTTFTDHLDSGTGLVYEYSCCTRRRRYIIISIDVSLFTANFAFHLEKRPCLVQVLFQS